MKNIPNLNQKEAGIHKKLDDIRMNFRCIEIHFGVRKMLHEMQREFFKERSKKDERGTIRENFLKKIFILYM